MMAAALDGVVVPLALLLAVAACVVEVVMVVVPTPLMRFCCLSPCEESRRVGLLLAGVRVGAGGRTRQVRSWEKTWRSTDWHWSAVQPW
jgi:hypothetical protein